MGLGMFQKHRREREAVLEDELRAELTAALEAAEGDDEKAAIQAKIDRISEDVKASQEALAERDDPSAHGVERQAWTADNETKQVGETSAENGGLGNAGQSGDGEPPVDGPEKPSDPETGEETRQEGPTSADNGGQGNAGVDGDGTPESPAQALEVPAGNASKADWTAYALANGKTEQDLADLNRDAIRDLFA